MADVTKTLKDAAYVVIGLGVIGFQKAQVRRNELTKQLDDQRKQFEAQTSDLRDQLTKLIQGLEQQFGPVATEIEHRLDEFEQRLPDQAQALVPQARGPRREARTEARN